MKKAPAVDPFLALADPSRRQILRLLSKNSLTINALAENFEMSRPAVSKHIKLLAGAGFISIETIGRERYCLLHKKGFDQLQGWIDHFDTFWISKLKKLERLLDEKAGGRSF